MYIYIFFWQILTLCTSASRHINNNNNSNNNNSNNSTWTMQSIWISATAGSCHPVQLFWSRPGRLHHWPWLRWDLWKMIYFFHNYVNGWCWLIGCIWNTHLVFCVNNTRHFGFHTEIEDVECLIQYFDHRNALSMLYIIIIIIFTCIKSKNDGKNTQKST